MRSPLQNHVCLRNRQPLIKVRLIEIRGSLMKVLKWLAISLAGLIVAICGVGFFLPDTAHVERSIVINAKPATVFTVLNGFALFNQWSPWANIDPAATNTVSGPHSGVGAMQAWAGNEDVGTGSQEIIESTPYTMIKIKLVFGDFTSENTATYTLTPEGEGTHLTWGYDTISGGNLMYRYFGLMMDGMLGPDYEKGLARLKTLVESLPKEDFADLSVELVDTKSVTVAYAAGEVAVTDPAQASAVIGALYGKVGAFMAANGAKQADAPMAITQSFDEQSKLWKFFAAIPVDNPALAAPPESEVKVLQTYAGRAIKATHKGAYSAMEPTYNKLMAYKAAMGLEDNGNSWEHYVTDPGKTPEAELVTYIYWPVK